MLDFAQRGHISVQIVREESGAMVLEGYVNSRAVDAGYTPVASTAGGGSIPFELHACPLWEVGASGRQGMVYSTRFCVELPLADGACYGFAFLKNGKSVPLKASMGLWAKFGSKKAVRNNTYWVAGGHIVTFAHEKLEVRAYSRMLHAKLERRLQKGIAAAGRKDMADLRRRYHRADRKKKRAIWIVSDRVFKGGDNAENFFEYASKQPQAKDIDMYFVFSREQNPVDYERISRYGRTVDPESEDYRLLVLLADKVVSSHFGRAVTSPFLDDYYFVKDLYNFDYVYLTHGVMPGDLSKILNRLNKNIRMFVTSSRRELKSIREGGYFYTGRELRLTGMPRHDALDAARTRRKVVFLPTWRRGLAGEELQETRDRAYSEGFKESAYCRFYNALINDERLVAALREAGYTGEFYVHPSFRKQAGDFHGNACVSVGDGLADYEAILNEAALMVTDYSSVAFDFGYMRKPIVYCQFDSEQMEAEHFYDRGYFEYGRDGFGPVTHTLDQTVEAIVGFLRADCAMPDEYRERADAFFEFDDRANCERVFRAVMELG